MPPAREQIPPRVLAIVHLVTLGWITASILGSLFLVGPIALRVRFEATWLDYGAFGLFAAGTAGMVVQFWMSGQGEVAWSTAVVGTGLLLAVVRVLSRLEGAGGPRSVKAHIVLALVNLLGAATLGMLIAFDRDHRILSGGVLSNVAAHAHLAAIGWATMMVVGVAYRLLPMVLPAQMPAGPRLWFTAALLETGVIGLVITLLRGAGLSWIFALAIASGLATFFAEVARMHRRRRPRPPVLRTPDPAVLHAVAAFMCLGIAVGMGLRLTVAETFSPQFVLAYGVFGLVGFLAQIVVGMEGRLLPTFSWYWASVNAGSNASVPSPHVMGWWPGQLMVFALWLAGVPLLAGGFAFSMIPLVRVAAWALFAAVLLDTLNVAVILRHAFTPGTRASS